MPPENKDTSKGVNHSETNNSISYDIARSKQPKQLSAKDCLDYITDKIDIDSPQLIVGYFFFFFVQFLTISYTQISFFDLLKLLFLLVYIPILDTSRRVY